MGFRPRRTCLMRYDTYVAQHDGRQCPSHSISRTFGAGSQTTAFPLHPRLAARLCVFSSWVSSVYYRRVMRYRNRFCMLPCQDMKAFNVDVIDTHMGRISRCRIGDIESRLTHERKLPPPPSPSSPRLWRPSACQGLRKLFDHALALPPDDAVFALDIDDYTPILHGYEFVALCLSLR